MRQYRLWDVETNNLLGHFDTEEEALGAVKELLETFGVAYAEEIWLGGRDERDNELPPLAGADLADRALSVRSSAHIT